MPQMKNKTKTVTLALVSESCFSARKSCIIHGNGKADVEGEAAGGCGLSDARTDEDDEETSYLGRTAEECSGSRVRVQVQAGRGEAKEQATKCP